MSKTGRVATLSGVFIVCLAAPIAIGTAVQASDGTSDEYLRAQFVDAGGVQAEYASVVAKFPHKLPPGNHFPKNAPYTFGPAETLYEKGIGESSAYFYWQCAWMNEALSGSLPPGIVAAQLDGWESTAFYKEHFVNDRGLPTWEDEVVRAAEASDLIPMEQSYAATCTGPLEIGASE